MADWRSRKGGDPDMDDEPVRRDKGRRGRGRGSRGFDSRQGFGGPEDLGYPPDFGGPIYGGEQPTPRDFPPRDDFSHGRDNSYGRDNDERGFDDRRSGGGTRGDDHGADRPNGGFRPRNDAPRPERAATERGPRQNGTVKFFKADKGFGFITPDEGAVDVFVHISAVERSGLTGLESGQRLSFATEPDRRGKGPKAVELRLEDGED